MDPKTAYEITITEKLEQITVPDMVDAIWARIETQLDIDMPTDEGPSHPPTGPAVGGGFWFGLIFIAAVVSVIYLINTKAEKNNNSPVFFPETPAAISAPGTTNDKPPPSPGVTNPPLIRTNRDDTANFVPGNVATASNDSVSSINPSGPDSSNARPVDITPPVINLPVDTAGKKRRGVKGIQDGDYKIVPAKKDSGGK